MATDKKIMFCEFNMSDASINVSDWTLKQWREKLSGDFQMMWDIPSIFSKTWWVNMDERKWGALYVFNSEAEQKEYAQSDLWVNKVPEIWGKPKVTVLDVACMLIRNAITNGAGSWEANQ